MWLYLLFVLIVIGSGGLVLVLKPNNNTFKQLLSFSGAYLFGLIFLHLAPEVYDTGAQHLGGIQIGLYILLGFLIQLGLDYLSKGIEHGHSHYHSNVFPFAIFIGLCLHSFFEGFPTLHIDPASGQQTINTELMLGILVHKIPIAVVLMSVLLLATKNKTTAFFWLFLFALTLPMGALTNYLIEQNIDTVEPYQSITTAIVIGILLHVATTILYENDAQHRFNLQKLLTILAGFAVAYFTLSPHQ